MHPTGVTIFEGTAQSATTKQVSEQDLDVVTTTPQQTPLPDNVDATVSDRPRWCKDLDGLPAMLVFDPYGVPITSHDMGSSSVTRTPSGQLALLPTSPRPMFTPEHQLRPYEAFRTTYQQNAARQPPPPDALRPYEALRTTYQQNAAQKPPPPDPVAEQLRHMQETIARMQRWEDK